MEEVKFKTNDKNPFTQLSELRFSVAQEGKGFELSCQLMFGKMAYDHKDREYEIGVSRAHLRLTLEGCETTLGNVFGESVLAPMAEEDSIEAQECAGIETSVGMNAISGVNAGANASASAHRTRKRKLSQNKLHRPVTARPNDSWEVKPLSVTGRIQSVMASSQGLFAE